MTAQLEGYSSDSDIENCDSARKELTASVNAMMSRHVESYDENCTLIKLRFKVKNKKGYVKLGIIWNIKPEFTAVIEDYYITNSRQISAVNSLLTRFYDRWKDEYTYETYETHDRD